MSDQMLQPHYLMIHTRQGWVPIVDGRKPIGSTTSLPQKFKDWWDANYEATKGVGSNDLCKIFPYYPEHAEGERLYIDRLIADEEAYFARLTASHEEKLGALLAERGAVPA
jgi:hypothetical protein